MQASQLVPLLGCLAVGQVSDLASQPQASALGVAEIRTSGVGHVSLSPDRAILRIGVETEDSAAALAAERNKIHFAGVLDTLRALGFPPDSLQRLSYTVGPNYDWERSRQIIGYRARAVIAVTLRDLNSLAMLIDGVLAAGATDIPSVEFESDRADSARAEALGEALRRAAADAETLSAAHGGHLGRLLEVGTTRRDEYEYVFAQQSYSPAFGPMDLAPREVHVLVTVSTRWELLP